MKDTIVKELTELYESRSNIGLKKYGVTLDRTDLTLLEWHRHHLEELMDASLYTLKIIKLLEAEQNKGNLPGYV